MEDVTAVEIEETPIAATRELSLSMWCMAAAFGTYFCMYAFRKPFTAAPYADSTFFDIDYKTIFVTSQVIGYTLSKFLGIKIVAEVTPGRRAALLLALIAVALVALLLFAVTPPPFNGIWLFVNGVPLGMVFSLVVGFLEGRRQTEALTAGLCASFIVADGVTKSTGAFLLRAGVSQYWMPFSAGLLFVPPLLLFVWMLTRIPAPSAEDVTARSERAPLNRAERWAFFRRYAVGLTLMVSMFLLITILRSVRADFAPEIWKGLLGTSAASEVYTWSEMAVAAGVLLLSGATVLIQDHRRAFFVALALALGGAVLIAASLLGLQAGALSPLAFMILIGLGLYLPYLVVHTTLFERWLAMTRERGNIGYLICLADSFGYLGYVAVLFAHNFFAPSENFLSFFVALSWSIAIACILLLVPCWRYFARHPAASKPAAERSESAGLRAAEFAPSPLMGEGWGGGDYPCNDVSPPPLPSPTRGEGDQKPAASRTPT